MVACMVKQWALCDRSMIFNAAFAVKNVDNSTTIKSNGMELGEMEKGNFR